MKKIILIIILFFTINNFTFSQVYVEQTDVQITGIKRGSIDWSDCNNDGLLDFVLTGNSGGGNNYYSSLFVNKGNNIFNQNNGLIKEVEWSSFEWGDYNNDNYTDGILSGIVFLNKASIDYTIVYKNKVDENFEEQFFSNLIQTSEGDVLWEDYDNDAYLDILQTGTDSYGMIISKMYKNNKNNSFTEQTQIYIDGSWFGSLIWFDYNNDNFIDFVLTGSDGTIQKTYLYENNGKNDFVKQSKIEFINVMNGSIDVCDYNNDSFLDIIISGLNLTENKPLTSIYKNNGDETFTKITNNQIADICYGSIKWGDYNNDGLSDIFLTGWYKNEINYSRYTFLYKNNENDVFTKQTEETFIPVAYSDISFGDYNNDNKLDILLCGTYASSSETTKLYKNTTPIANIRPNVINNLQTKIVGNTVFFSWDEATDPNQPSAGLNYNIYVYEEANRQHIMLEDTVFDGMYIASPQAFPYYHELNGKRLIPKRGHIQGIRENGRVSYFLIGRWEDCKKYYWSVQAIDASFDGGAFAPEATFIYDTIAPQIECNTNQTIQLTEGQTFYTVQDTEFNPVSVSDNCQNYTVTNSFNNSSSLANAQLPIGTTSINWTVTDAAGNQTECCTEIIVVKNVGISNLLENQVEIYPNPTDKMLNINFVKAINLAKVEIINPTGTKIKTLEITTSQTAIDVSSFPSGIYLLIISENNKILVTKKVVVK